MLRLPTDDDLLALMDLAKAGIHPPDEMPFAVPWSIGESPEFERGFLSHHWEARAAWSIDDWRLNLMVEADEPADRVAERMGSRVSRPPHGRHRVVAGS